MPQKVFLKKYHLDVSKFKRSEETLENYFPSLFLTILLGKLMKINPYNQPSVELIKKETFKILK